MLLTRIRLAKEVTLGLIKPTVTSSPYVVNRILKEINNNGMNIINAKKVKFDNDMAEAFYGEHKGKFFYPRLYHYVRSGPVIALALEGEDVIAKWRQLIGPTKVARTKFENPDTLRHDFGITDTRNGFHGSDSMDKAFYELSIVFGDLINESKTIESVKDSNFTIESVLNVTEGEIEILGPVISKVDPEKTHFKSKNPTETAPDLAKNSFWESFHKKGQKDWFIETKDVVKQLLDEDELSNRFGNKEIPSEKITVMDIGCGTSTLGATLAAKFKSLNVILTDFSNEACEIQADRFLNVQSKYKNAGLGDDILVDNNSSLEILSGNAKSLNIATGSVDYLIDKGFTDAISRLEEDQWLQIMDEQARVMKPDGVIYQFTEEPPEARLELWNRWLRSTNYKLKIRHSELDFNRFMYRIQFE